MERPGVVSGLCVFSVDFFHYFAVSCPRAKTKMLKEGLGWSNILLYGMFPPTSEEEGRKYRKENLHLIILKGKILSVHWTLNFGLSFVIEPCYVPLETQFFLSNKPPYSKGGTIHGIRIQTLLISWLFSSGFEALGTGSGSVESGHARAVQLQLDSCVKYPFWSGCCREIRNNPQSPSIKLN